MNKEIMYTKMKVYTEEMAKNGLSTIFIVLS